MAGRRKVGNPYRQSSQPLKDGTMGRIQIAVIGVILSLVTFALIEVAADERCPTTPQCQCSFDTDDDNAVLPGATTDKRSVGLAAATGALSSIVLAGGGIALWKHLKNKGNGEIGDMYNRPPSSQGSWMDERKEHPGNRRGSYPYSDDGSDFNSGRMTAASGKSNATNIYKHGGKIWPGSR